MFRAGLSPVTKQPMCIYEHPMFKNLALQSVIDVYNSFNLTVTVTKKRASKRSKNNDKDV